MNVSLPLSPEVFAILSALIEERVGLHYGPEDRELLASKISARAIEAGFETLLDYYYFLRYDAAGEHEMESLIDLLVVNETYLFREDEQVRVLVDQFLAPRARAGERLRVWSAACSTGEEPYSIAMRLAEHGVLDRVELVATDVSRRALARARTGELSRRALRAVPGDAPLDRYLERGGSDTVRIAEPLRRAVSFRRVNLLDDLAVAQLGHFDAIVCRNVLIYFREATTRAVVERLARALRAGGTIWVGVSESLMRLGTSLVVEEQSGVFSYRSAQG